MLANAGQHGAMRSLLIANGFAVPMINALVSQGFATLTYEKVLVGTNMIDMAKVRITEVGREVPGREARLRSKA